jgi:hypothetical protein
VQKAQLGVQTRQVQGQQGATQKHHVAIREGCVYGIGGWAAVAPQKAVGRKNRLQRSEIGPCGVALEATQSLEVGGMGQGFQRCLQLLDVWLNRCLPGQAPQQRKPRAQLALHKPQGQGKGVVLGVHLCPQHLRGQALQRRGLSVELAFQADVQHRHPLAQQKSQGRGGEAHVAPDHHPPHLAGRKLGQGLLVQLNQQPALAQAQGGGLLGEVEGHARLTGSTAGFRPVSSCAFW